MKPNTKSKHLNAQFHKSCSALAKVIHMYITQAPSLALQQKPRVFWLVYKDDVNNNNSSRSLFAACAIKQLIVKAGSACAAAGELYEIYTHSHTQTHTHYIDDGYTWG